MFARGGALTTAHVVFPQYRDSALPDTVRFDQTAVPTAVLELFGPTGKVGTARVGSVSATVWSGDGCIEWPAAHLELQTDGARAAGWTVAFLEGRLQPIPLDSIEGLASTDSAQLAAAITRLASTLPDDTAHTFRGVPLSVRMAYRFTAAPGVQALVADVVRTLNLEATPLEQHTLLVAERRGGTGAEGYRVVYHSRSAGSEETLETTDVLAAVRFAGSNRVALVLLREGMESSAYALLERDERGRWHQRWTSVHTGC